MRFLATTALLLLSPAAAMAEGTMPQMDFHNPLTGAQVLWMVVILVVLYFVLARWGLPEVGKVLENREAVILRDLTAAQGAKSAADQAVTQLNATMAQARNSAQAQIAAAVAQAKAEAAVQAAALAAKLDQKLAESEAQIAAARRQALGAIKPVAAEAAGTIMLKLTGTEPASDALGQRVDEALAARKVA
jgi:F-type H+-transporting ATPase subunit b